MKKLLSLFVILFTSSVFADLPDIVALVNDEPITKYDFLSRKQMAIVLNNIDVSDPSLDKSLNSDILNILVEEELLTQHAKKVGGSISTEELDAAITTIEQRNNMPKGAMGIYLREKNVDVASFRKQIQGELIKHNIISSLMHSVSVSPIELDVAIINSSDQNFNVEAWIFTAQGSTDDDLKKMHYLKKRLTTCDKVTDKLYTEFAEGKKFDHKLKQMPAITQSIVLDTKAGSSSSIYQENDKFQMVLLCKKESSVSSGDLNKIKSFLSNKKMSKKAEKFFKDLRSKAYIKIMIPT